VSLIQLEDWRSELGERIANAVPRFFSEQRSSRRSSIECRVWSIPLFR
jgi:hypothetical protein